MRNLGTRLLAALVGLVALAGLAQAQTTLNGSCDVAGADASALCEYGAYPDDQYYDADAGATGERASGLVDADASHTDPETAAEGTLFGWISLHWDAFVAALGETLGMAGQETPALDGGVDLYVSEDGVDLDAGAAGLDFDASPAGELDGKTFEALGQANAAKADAEATITGALG